MDIKKKIGLVLKGLRDKANIEGTKIKQSDIANDAGISLKFYNELENGKRMPSIDVIMKIANAHGLKLSKLCELIENYEY